MKRFESKEEIEKRRKRNIKIMSGLMLSVMVVSTFAFGYSFFMGNDENKNGENEEIQQIGDEWLVRYGNNYLRFRNNPKELRNISTDINSDIETYYGKIVYIASDNKGALYEIEQNLGNYVERIQEVCYGNCDKDLPEKNCSDLLIVFNESAESKIYEEENCVFIEGDLRTVDAFLWEIFRLK